MIRRIVVIKLADAYASEENRERAVLATREVLAEVPGVVDIEVATPADARTLKSWDLFISLSFEDMDAVEAYRAHPIHRKYVDVFLRPMLEVLKAWNFELPARRDDDMTI